MYLVDCSWPVIKFAVNNHSFVGSEVSLAVGDELTCSAEGAVLYRWRSLHDRNTAKIYGPVFVMSRLGSFNCQCVVFMDCGIKRFCSFSKNISGIATGMHQHFIILYSVYTVSQKNNKQQYVARNIDKV